MFRKAVPVWSSWYISCTSSNQGRSEIDTHRSLQLLHATLQKKAAIFYGDCPAIAGHVCTTEAICVEVDLQVVKSFATTLYWVT